MTHFKLVKSDSKLAKLQEENRKLIRRERRLRKLVPSWKRSSTAN